MALLLMDDDGGINPASNLFNGALFGNINMMEDALRHPGVELHAYDPMEGRTALHFAAECPGKNGVAAVRWLLERGIPWNVRDGADNFPEITALSEGNSESFELLREWAIDKEYHLYHTTKRPEDDPSYEKPFNSFRLDNNYENQKFCISSVMYMYPNGAPESEVAMLSVPGGEGIMMEWERPIMKRTAELLLDGMPTKGLRILNIGFGLGMIDTYFQEAHPAEHVIIEPHSQALALLRVAGWFKKPGVKILEGRWQAFLEHESNEYDVPVVSYPEREGEDVVVDIDSLQVVPRTRVDIGKFDIVYFDTYMEGYRGHYAFIKHIPRLLKGPGSRFSFFHGHGSKKRSLNNIYKEVATRHHNDIGLNTEWSQVHVDRKLQWHNIKNRGKGVPYNHPQLIPICTLAPTVPRTIVPDVAWNPYPSRLIEHYQQ